MSLQIYEKQSNVTLTKTDFTLFECGNKFSSYSEFEEAKKLYENSYFTILVKATCMKFHEGHKFRETLVYQTAIFECKKGPYRKPSKAKGIRPNVKTGKLGCHFKLKLSACGGFLVVKESILEHSYHELSEERFRHFPENLKLNAEEMKEAELCIQSGENKKKIQAYLIEKRGGKPVTLKTLHNIATKMQKNQQVKGLTDSKQMVNCMNLISGEINVVYDDVANNVERNHRAFAMTEKVPIKVANVDEVEFEIMESLSDFSDNHVSEENEKKENREMARTKQTSRSVSIKRFPVAVASGKSVQENKRFKPDNEKDTNVPQVKSVANDVEVITTNTIIPSKITSHAWAYIQFNDGIDSSCTEGLTDEMKGLPPNAGKWLLFNDEEMCPSAGMSHHDYAWTIAKSLVEDSINTGILAAKCSTARSIEEDGDQGVVCCYTENFKDMQSVKKAAEAIRKAYPYPLNMYYKAEQDSHSGVYNRHGDRFVTMYKHTIHNKFYARKSNNGYSWQLVDFCEVAINETTMPSQVSSHQWLYILPGHDTNGITVCASDSIDDIPETAGKWLLFNSANSVCPLKGMSHHDYAWSVLRPLVNDFENSGVIAIKGSTTAKNNFYSGQGVICCYTENYGDKASVKKAAEAIRKAYPYPDAMFFKREEDSERGLYNINGNRSYTIYKHLPGNGMFERCSDGVLWKLAVL